MGTCQSGYFSKSTIAAFCFDLWGFLLHFHRFFDSESKVKSFRTVERPKNHKVASRFPEKGYVRLQ
jgi:hypothetical protein